MAVQKALVVRSRERERATQATFKWFAQCKSNNMPYIVMYRGSKHCDVQYDSVTLNDQTIVSLEKNRKEITRLLLDLADRYNAKSRGVSEVFTIYYGVANESSSKFIDELTAIIEANIPARHTAQPSIAT